ncbi:sigma-70 family RNA polymerase sigma factor [Glaciecola sp. MH2013]|uniref:RNA polymerase sigma factor n=1 Tax=Glaciecola sp. MH2013 TaxID=2785524 RepID=UPI0018A09C37|nr:sigma-70 family RNA polymerase sigma factor [Glaciecola sp. MH2013]MBF7072591.1 sigma-70 family RNA polymerase sigma factor [Glaciecola sp. MH2013]
MASIVDSKLTSVVEKAQNGDLQAYETLIHETRNLVTSIALAVVKDVDDSEEIAQQVFVSLWQNIQQLNNAGSFIPWLRQSTRYTAFNFLRSNKNYTRLDEGQFDNEALDESDAESQICTKEQNAVIQELIDALPPEDREIIILFYREEQSSAHVAKLLDLSEANVRKKLSRTRLALKDEFVKKAGKAIFATAPAVGFSGAITGLLAPTSQAVAGVTGASVSAKVSGSSLSKFFVILGGAMIGAFLAVFATIWSSNIAIKQLNDNDDKQTMRGYRNELIAWILTWGVLLTIAYELTDGWFWPLITFVGFSIGLFVLMLRSMRFVYLKSGSQPVSKGMKLLSYACLVLGIASGFSGLIIGLIGSGRF